MAYFSNGTEGMIYEEKYCSRCVHNDGCPVWGLHFEQNYTKNEEIRSILDYLIPRRKDGLGNELCRMFYEGETERTPSHIPLKGTVARLKNRVVMKAMQDEA